MDSLSLQILLVEDNPTDVLLLEEALGENRTSRFALTIVRRLDEALAVLRDKCFDAVLLDLGLPDCQGLETFVKMQNQYPRVPVLVLSGLDDETVALRAVQEGAQDYLVKGVINGRMLARTIRYAIERKRSDLRVKASEACYRRLFETAQDGIFILDAVTGQITDANPYLETLLDHNVAEFIGKRLWEIAPFRDKTASHAAFRTLQEKAFFRYEALPLTARDGRQVYVEFTSNIYEVDSRQVIQCNIRDITERLQTEAECREIEARKTAIFETALDCIISMDDRGRVIEFNPAAEKTFGYRRDEAIGQLLSDLIIPPALREHHLRGLAHFLATGEGPLINKRIELSAMRADGAEFPVELSICRVILGERSIFTGYLRDITERKQAEDTLRASEQLNRSILESSTDCIKLLDTEAGIVSMNGPGRCLMEVVDFNMIKGGCWSGFWTGEAADLAHAALEAAKAGGSGRFQGYCPTLKGTPKWWDVTVTPILDEQGNVVQLVSSSRDITESKRAEQELLDSEKRFSNAFEYSAIGMALVELNGRWLQVNKALCNLLGYTAEELSRLTFQDITHPDDLDENLENIHAMLDGKTRFYNTEKRYFHKQGHVLWMLLGVSLVRDTEEHPLYFIYQIQDITERKQAATALESRSRVASLGASVGRALTQSGSLHSVLHLCCEDIVKYLDGAFARIWTLNEAENVLELQASAGLYTHLDGAHSRVPVGKFKIGLIAAERQPHLTNSVIGDPRVGDQEWAKREGMVAFAGYPLIVGKQVVGVMAMFSRHELSELTLKGLGSVADEIALGINHKRTEQALQQANEELESRVIERTTQLYTANALLSQEAALVRLLQRVTELANEAGNFQTAVLACLDQVCAHVNWPVGHSYSVSTAGETTLVSTDLWHLETPDAFEAFVRATQETTLSSGVGLPGRALAAGKAVWASNVTEDSNFPRAQVAGDIKVRAGFAFPVKVGKEIVALLEFYSAEIVEPDLRLLDVMEHIGLQLGRVVERRRAEEALYKNHEFLEAVLENTAEGIVACDAKGHLTIFNRATREFHGLPMKPLSSDQWAQYYSLYWPDGITPMQMPDVPLFRALAGEHVRDTEMVIAPTSGEPRFMVANGEPLFDAAGETMGAVVVMHDITERRLTEASLRMSEEKYRLLWAGAGDAFVLFDSDNKIIEANAAVATIFGYQPAEVIGQNISLLQPEQLREGHRQGIQRYLATGVKTLNWRMAEAVGLHRDGREFPVEIAFNHLRLDGKDLFAGFIRDVTTRKQVEEALRIAKEEADTANLAKSEFLSRMSHELRTPLNAILGFGQILDKQDLTELQQECVRHMVKGGRHLLHLINEVLDIARVESGHSDLSIEPVSLTVVVNESCALVSPLAAQRGVGLQFDLGELHQSYVLADHQRLKQVLLNLLSNAIKYNRTGGRVTFSCEQLTAGRMRLGVRDTGSGIAANDLSKLFVPFERLNAGNVEGTGLGLVLSRRLVEAMQGTLTVESTLGLGTTFYIELPVSQVSPARPCALMNTLTQEAGSAPLPLRTVLCIEDNLSNLRLLELLLAGRPEITLMAAMQGSLGLELARQQKLDLILLDLNLPDISGEEVLVRLQQSALTSDIPVIIVSADATPMQIERLLGGGARAYLTKPLDFTEFMKALDEVLTVEVPHRHNAAA